MVSRPQSSNPFPGAYLNARVKVTCEHVSIIHQTLLKLEVSFLTEFHTSVGTSITYKEAGLYHTMTITLALVHQEG